MKQANTKRIGAFVFTGGLLAFIAIILFSNPDFFVKKSYYVAYFEQSVIGLNKGAPIMFRGVTVGEVIEIDGFYDAEEVIIRPRLILEFKRGTIKNTPESQVGGGKSPIFQPLIDHGMRATLKSKSMLTGQLFVSLDFYPDKPVRMLGNSDDPYPEFPTLDSGFSKMLSKLEDLPLTEVLNQLDSTLKAAEDLLENPGLKKALDDLPTLVSDIDSLVVDDLTSSLDQLKATLKTGQTSLKDLTGMLTSETLPGFQATLDAMRSDLALLKTRLAADDPLNRQMMAMLRQLTETAKSIEMLADYLEQHPEALLKGK